MIGERLTLACRRGMRNIPGTRGSDDCNCGRRLPASESRRPLQRQLQLQEHRQDCLCYLCDWMVLEPSIAGYGTRLGSLLYSAGVRLDNLGRCFDFAACRGTARLVRTRVQVRANNSDCGSQLGESVCGTWRLGRSGLGSKGHSFYCGCKRSYTTGNEGDDWRRRSPFPGTPIGLLPTTAKFEIVPGLLLGNDAAPGIRGVNKR